MRKWRQAACFLAAVCIGLSISACKGEKEEKEEASSTEFHMYYLSPMETALETVDYIPKKRDAQSMVQEVAGKLKEDREEDGYLQLLPDQVKILNITYEGQTVRVDFDSEYKKMKNTREILARAGIVKAFTQIPGVSYVEFTEEGEPMRDASGELIGKMDKSTFVENEGENINSYVHTSLNLYFADQEGDSLKKENISVYYSSNVPLERKVIERLLKGPKSEELRPTLSPNTKILGVSIVEGICYVNLDKSFLTDSMDVQEKLPIYSIVNSLTDACGVRGVQISVEGDTKVTFRESMKLDEIYHADYRLIEDNKEAKD